MADLSIVIVSFNTAEMTKRCLSALLKNIIEEKNITTEVIVVDNASSDSTVDVLKKLSQEYSQKGISLTTIMNSENLGYSKANNKGANITKGKYLLFLNSDVLVEKVLFGNLIHSMNADSTIGAMTAKVVLSNGSLDPASHRGFPTVWRSFSYFSGLEKVFGKVPFLNRVFGGYHLTFLNLTQIHEIDSPTGAFYLARRDAFEKVDGFDEDFFMYGEDLDLSLRIKNLGYKILYNPVYSVTHLKYQSGLKSKDDTLQEKTKGYFYDAMRIFYQKHYASRKPSFVNNLVYWAIDRRRKKI